MNIHKSIDRSDIEDFTFHFTVEMCTGDMRQIIGRQRRNGLELEQLKGERGGMRLSKLARLWRRVRSLFRGYKRTRLPIEKEFDDRWDRMETDRQFYNRNK